MIPDCLSNFFKKFKKKKTTRFTATEMKAKKLMVAFIGGSISHRDFATAFNEVREEFLQLLIVDGQTTLDEDTPLWLNSLLGFHFIDWLRFQQVRQFVEDHPEKLTEKNRKQYERILDMSPDERFKSACIKALDVADQK